MPVIKIPLYFISFLFITSSSVTHLILINEPTLFENMNIIVGLLDESLSPLDLDVHKCRPGNFQLKFLNHS